METNKLLKKLEEIKEELYNNVHSSEKGSPLQVNSVTEFELDEDAKGEDVKIERTKGEKVTVPKTLSRTTSMDGGKGPSKDIYITDGTTKKSIQEKLNDLKMIKAGDYFGSGRTELEESLLRTMEKFAATIEELEHEVRETPSDAAKDELEHYKGELKKLEDILAGLNDPEFKLYKRLLKNDPMTAAKLLLREKPRTGEENTFIMLQDAVDRKDVGDVQQILPMVTRGM